MKQIALLKNPVQTYDWGSYTAIPELLGQPTTEDKPYAELWMGAHRKAPSRIQVNGEWRTLPEVIEDSPREILGPRVAERFHGRLPFLFKVLAAARPLSIQAHPTLAQAREGFKRENDLGIPPDAPERNYRDDNHKPETICALTPFSALNGFRRIEEIIAIFRACGTSGLSKEIGALERVPGPEGLRTFLGAVLGMEKGRQRRAIEQVVRFAEDQGKDDPVKEWILRLHAHYPSDIGVLSPLLLNLVQLAPGQAMFLHAGRLHTYLEGTGIELMASSDNVLRGGLTSKHMDIPELLNILSFQEDEITVLTPEDSPRGDQVYASEAEEFRLSVIHTASDKAYKSPEDRSVEIMICTHGRAAVKNLAEEKTLEVPKGVSFLVPAAVRQYTIHGDAILYRASVP